MSGRAARALALAAVLAAGCQDPAGRCDTTADCGAGERCDGGVCVRLPDPGGNGSGGGTDLTTFTPVLWSTLATAAGASFAPSSVSADGASGDVLVSGAVEGPFDPWGVGTGGFIARAAGAGGALATTALPFPSFSHGGVRTAALPGGGLLFAGAAVDPTSVGTYLFVPPVAGALVLGRLDAAGDPVWAVTVDAAAAGLAPVAIAARGEDLVVAGSGAGDFGCGNTGAASFAAALSGADGRCIWSRGFANRSVSDLEARAAGDVALAGLCPGPSFDPDVGTTCAGGLYVTVLSGASGGTSWLTTSSGAGSVRVRDLSVAPDGSVALVGDAHGTVDFGGASVDLGASEASFVAVLGPTGTPQLVAHPVEAPYAPLPDAASFSACAWDRNGKLWIAGRYYGQPTFAGARFPSCREACVTAAFLARLDPVPGAAPTVGSFLPVQIGRSPGGAAFADDLLLGATTGTVAWALRFSGDATVGAARWTSDAAGLAVVRVAP